MTLLEYFIISCSKVKSILTVYIKIYSQLRIIRHVVNSTLQLIRTNPIMQLLYDCLCEIVFLIRTKNSVNLALDCLKMTLSGCMSGTQYVRNPIFQKWYVNINTSVLQLIFISKSWLQMQSLSVNKPYDLKSYGNSDSLSLFWWGRIIHSWL